MDQQQQGGRAAPGEAPAPVPRPADELAMNDSTWGEGAASALDNLRRHNFRVRRSKESEDEGPGPD